MKLLQTLLAGALTPLFLSMPALASPEAHKRLVGAVESIGVTVLINNYQLCDDDSDGMYSSGYGAMVICQDNMIKPDKVVAWTENDYDTLRHEAHHIVQDCIDGQRGDNNLETVFEGRELAEFVYNSGIGEQELEGIIGTYQGKRGLDDEQTMVEIEAFAVARSISADSITNTLLRVCQ